MKKITLALFLSDESISPLFLKVFQKFPFLDVENEQGKWKKAFHRTQVIELLKCFSHLDIVFRNEKRVGNN